MELPVYASNRTDSVTPFKPELDQKEHRAAFAVRFCTRAER